MSRPIRGLKRSQALVAFGVLLLATCSGERREPLVVYSPHGRELLEFAERTFEELNPGVDVRWLDMGSQDALDRVRSERANPQADVWFGGPSSMFALAAAESLLVAYSPAWAASIPERARGQGGFYHAVYETPAVIAFNSKAVPGTDAPRDWDDVLDPRWKGKVIIRDPMASGTMRAIFGMIIQRSIRSTGDTAQGFDWLRRLDGQTREYVLNPALLHQKLLRQEGVITLWDLPDILIEQQKGSPFDFVLPESGVPVIEDAIAIVRGTAHRDLAERFVDWVGSTHAMLRAAHENYRLPARVDIPVDSLPPWAGRVRREMKVEEIDWVELSHQGPKWMRYWDRKVRGKGGGHAAR